MEIYRAIAKQSFAFGLIFFYTMTFNDNVKNVF
jgi:hypothetical protein